MKSKGPKTIAIILIFVIIFILILMKIYGPSELLDAKVYYSGGEARSLLKSFGPDDLNRYFANEILDFLLIISYSALSNLAYLSIIPRKRVRYVVSFAPGFFDFFETSCILFAVRFGECFSFFNWLGFITLLKWSTGAAVLSYWALRKALRLFSPPISGL